MVFDRFQSLAIAGLRASVLLGSQLAEVTLSSFLPFCVPASAPKEGLFAVLCLVGGLFCELCNAMLKETVLKQTAVWGVGMG
jgi:hypothetical protein